MIPNSDPLEHHIPQVDLEKQFISDYLKEKGYRSEDLTTLPKEIAHCLMVEACRYASLKLAEIESRSHLQRKIHFDS